MKFLKVHILKACYAVISPLSELFRLNFLIRHKLMLGALLIGLSLNSCRVHKNRKATISCHRYLKVPTNIKGMSDHQEATPSIVKTDGNS